MSGLVNLRREIYGKWHLTPHLPECHRENVLSSHSWVGFFPTGQWMQRVQTFLTQRWTWIICLSDSSLFANSVSVLMTSRLPTRTLAIPWTGQLQLGLSSLEIINDNESQIWIMCSYKIWSIYPCSVFIYLDTWFPTCHATFKHDI